MCSKVPRSNAHTTIAGQLQLQGQNSPQLKAKCLSDVFLFLCQLKYRGWIQFAIRRASILRLPQKLRLKLRYLSICCQKTDNLSPDSSEWMRRHVKSGNRSSCTISKFYLYYQPECRILYVRRRKVGPQTSTAKCMHASQPTGFHNENEFSARRKSVSTFYRVIHCGYKIWLF